MSGTFTIPLKRVIELTGGQTSFVNGNTVVTGGNIGLSHYPIFDESYRARLTGLIVDHYWNQEIGVESVDMFQLAMRRRMNEIMPRYNKMYESERLTIDPLKTVDVRVIYTGNSVQVVENENDNTQGVVAAGTTQVDSENQSNTTSDTTSNSESSNESDSSSKSRVVASETPQSFLSGNGDYATSANDVNGTTNNGATGSENSNQSVEGSDTGTGKTTGTSNDTSNTTANGTSKTDATQDRNDDTHTSGYTGIASDLIIRYRESLINIDLMVIADLADCFMQIWNNGDEYSNANTNRNRYY